MIKCLSCSAFDESQFIVPEKLRCAYEQRVRLGFQYMLENPVVVVCLGVNNISKIALSKIERTGQYFKSYSVITGLSRSRYKPAIEWNQMRRCALDNYGYLDYAIMIDLSVGSSWSYEGLADTFYNHDKWDASLSSFAPDGELLTRGGPMVHAANCEFGGLTVYKMESLRRSFYDGDKDCHYRFNERLRENGLGRILLNPNQIFTF